MAPVLERRARHVVAENARVLAAVAALDANDSAALGPLLTASHESLRDLFEVSSPELDALVDTALATPGVLGARLTGAGFGGCTLALVRREAVGALTAAIDAEYPKRTGLVATSFEVRPSRGAEVLHA
jgi:galactokinase